MLPTLGEVLYWAAFWIAVTVILLGLAAWLTDSGESWVGVTTFMAVALAIWLLGCVALWLSGAKERRRRRSRI